MKRRSRRLTNSSSVLAKRNFFPTGFLKRLTGPTSALALLKAEGTEHHSSNGVNETQDGFLTLDARQHPKDKEGEKHRGSELRVREGMKVVLPSLSQIKQFFEDSVNSI